MQTSPQHVRQQELELLRAVLHGDRPAGQTLVARYTKLIEMSVRQIYRRSGIQVKQDEVCDRVADIWLFLLDDNMRSLRRFDPAREIKLATWLALIARNKTIDYLRTCRRRFVSIDDAEQLEEQLGASPSPSEEIERKERTDIANSALAGLEDHDRRFLEAWYLDERDPGDLADEFGIAVGTVYSRRFKIQKKLKRLVGRMSRIPRGTTIH